MMKKLIFLDNSVLRDLAMPTLALFLGSSCLQIVSPTGSGGGGGSNITTVVKYSSFYEWDAVFVQGSSDDTVGASPSWGAPNVTASSNAPGNREGMGSGQDLSGNFYMFGGYSGAVGYMADLWKYDGSNWTWIEAPGSASATKVANAVGVCGTQGVTSAGNYPGARVYQNSWSDNAGNFWVFGGQGVDCSAGAVNALNDLFKFDGTYWTFERGNLINNQAHTGAQGTTLAANTPSARQYSSAAYGGTGTGAAYLFGGEYNGVGAYLNDLWKFDGTNWTWVTGSVVTNTTLNFGLNHGAQGASSAAYTPGVRTFTNMWVDHNGILWMFGGSDRNQATNLNDLWKFDGTNWTWVAGDATFSTNVKGVYGTQGTSASTNYPGARSSAATWVDSNNHLWLYGGKGCDSNAVCTVGMLNDLWKFDGTNWTWVAGGNTINAQGVYGSLGVASPTYHPGGRDLIGNFTDKNGNLWIYGGNGLDASHGGVTQLGDLWQLTY